MDPNQGKPPKFDSIEELHEYIQASEARRAMQRLPFVGIVAALLAVFAFCLTITTCNRQDNETIRKAVEVGHPARIYTNGNGNTTIRIEPDPDPEPAK